MGTLLIDQTTVVHTLDAELDLRQARWLRGAVAGRAARVEFHQHGGDGLVYRHPLIRYDVASGYAVVTGLAEGSLLLRSMPAFTSLDLGPRRLPVLERSVETRRVEVGGLPEPVEYAFRSPYLALNQDNHAAWERGNASVRRGLLERVVVGNLLSLAKAVGLHVEERLRAEVSLEPDGWHELKPGVRLLGFRGAFRVNFALPDGWGIGKSSSRGFGTVNRREA